MKKISPPAPSEEENCKLWANYELKEMKMKRLIKAYMLLLVVVLFAACASEDVAQDKKKENGTEAPKGGVIFAANGPKVSAKRLSMDGEDKFAGAKTRTNIKHTPGNGADAYWTSDDFIWVKDKNGNWQQSLAIELHDGGASAKFTLPGNKSDYEDGCEVRYTGPNSYVGPSAEYVTISNTATCTTPNDFSKAGDWGDCGSGIARNTGDPDKFNFTLKHKSAYLCFLPRCTNAALAPNVRLKKIMITVTKCYSPNPYDFISDCYDFDGENLSGSPYMIGTKDIVANISDFPLYTTANQTANATYMVVRPGKYDFRIEYTIKDPTTNVEAVITDVRPGITLDKGNIYDVTADLVPPIINIPKYYTWDAADGYDYWRGYENEQPTISQGEAGATQGPNFPKNNIDSRWYKEGSGALEATRSCSGCPNVNELWWYLKKGDPHWDAQGWVYIKDDHLHARGGLWLLKKEVILARLKGVGYSSSLTWNDLREGYWDTPGAPHTDYRTNNGLATMPFTQGRPYTGTGQYFFLPAYGNYDQGMLYNRGKLGCYWSSSATHWFSDDAYYLAFSSSSVGVNNSHRYGGFPAQTLE